MSTGENISKSDKRALIDDLLIKGMEPRRISRYMLEVHNVVFTEKSIQEYRKNYFRNENGLVHNIIQAAQHLADREFPATSDREVLAGYFSFAKTNEDLRMLYDRIRVMREYADKYPFDDSYDDRIVKLLGKAESIRNRVFRHQYEHMRKAVMLNIGKKISLAAINVFLPYVDEDQRKTVVARFESIVKPLLELTTIADEPEDIGGLREDDGHADGHADEIEGEIDSGNESDTTGDQDGQE